MKEKHSWGWPVAGYLFLGGLGGGMTIVSTIADIAFDEGKLFALGNIIASILIGIGSALLIFELGRPLRFWRVFSTQKAVMTVGAWLLGILIVMGAIYFTFWLPFVPWSSVIALRKLISVVNLLLGLGVITYTGVLLGSMKARPFWNSAVLPILFAVSGLSTGIAAQSLLAGSWPWDGSYEALNKANELLHSLDVGLIVFEIIILAVYIGMMRTTAREEAARAAERWLTGKYALSFWGGLVGIGLILPLTLYGMSNRAIIFAPICVLFGGLVMRFLVVYSDDRTLLPGEEKYYSRLPSGDELFLKVLK